MDWFVWRIVTSPKIHASLPEIETLWSLDDLLDAHLVLDAIEDAERKARTPHPRPKR